MSHDFELRRLTDKIKENHQAQERLTHSVMKARRDEQMELDRVRREYDMRIHNLESRQTAISKELERHERDLEALERKILKETEDEKRVQEERNRQEQRRAT